MGYEICYNVQKAGSVINGSFCTAKKPTPLFGLCESGGGGLLCAAAAGTGLQLERREVLSGENVAVIGHFLLWKTNRWDFSDGARPENYEKTEAA